MIRIVRAFSQALTSMRNGKLIKLLFISIGVNLLVLGGLLAAWIWLLTSVEWFSQWDTVADIGMILIATLLTVLFFPLLLPLIISFFDTDIAEAIEKQDYPAVHTPQPPFWPTLKQDIRFTLKVLLINILILPLYLLPGVNFLLYFLLNGYLVGLEFFNIVAGRHVSLEEAQRLRENHRFTLVAAGSAIVFCSTIPLVNLVAPMIGVALMVHYFHGLNPNYRQEIIPPESAI